MKTRGEREETLKATLDEAKLATADHDWVKATRLFHRIALAAPEKPANWHNLSLAVIRGGLAEDARFQRRAVLLLPSEPRYLNNFLVGGAGDLRARLNSWLLVLEPDYARALADQAFIHLRSGAPDSSLHAARRAQIVEPDLAEGIGRGAQALLLGGRVDAARADYRRYVAIDPTDRVGVGRDLARSGVLETDQAMTPAFVAGVFDGYASEFDTHLTGTLRYVGPSVLAGMLKNHLGGGVDRGVDLGCGSGLSGIQLRSFVTHLVGVDLSAGMLRHARERGVYDTLHQDEIVGWMRRETTRYALAMAADVTSYLGDLSGFFRAVGAILEVDGLLAMTVHEQRDGDFGIVDGETYSHSEAYVRRSANAVGLEIQNLKRGAMREERKQPLPTLFMVLRKT
jgi:predicted TPR repeat methyltransferase